MTTYLHLVTVLGLFLALIGLVLNTNSQRSIGRKIFLGQSRHKEGGKEEKAGEDESHCNRYH